LNNNGLIIYLCSDYKNRIGDQAIVLLNLSIPVDVIYKETSIPMNEQLDTLEKEERGR
jgi:hypothetical protein